MKSYNFHNFCVSAPPTKVEILGHTHNSKVSIDENHALTLECMAYNAKPAPKLIWYRGKTEMQG
jgi:hypothetical protein